MAGNKDPIDPPATTTTTTTKVNDTEGGDTGNTHLLRRSTRRSLAGSSNSNSSTPSSVHNDFDSPLTVPVSVSGQGKRKRNSEQPLASNTAESSSTTPITIEGGSRGARGGASGSAAETNKRSRRYSTRRSNPAPISDVHDASPSTSTSASQSSKSLGKRRAVSPASSSAARGKKAAEETEPRSGPVSKRRRLSSDATVSAESTSTPTTATSYNLRSRPSSSSAASKLNPASSSSSSKGVPSASRPAYSTSTMPKRNHKGSPSGSSTPVEGSSRRAGKDGPNSLRARAAANAALQAHNQGTSSASGANSSRNHNRRQRDPQYDMLGLDDDDDDDGGDGDFGDYGDEDDVFGTRVRDEDQALAIALAESAAAAATAAEKERTQGTAGSYSNDVEMEDEHAEGSRMGARDAYEEEDHHDEGGEGEHLDIREHSDSDDDEEDEGHHEDDIDDGEEEEEEEDIGPGDDGLDDEFEPPLTFDADGNPLPPASNNDSAVPALSGGREEPSDSEASTNEDESGLTRGQSGGNAAASSNSAPSDDGFGSFAASLRGFSGLMAGMSARLRTLLTNLRNKSDPSVRMIALQELSELLSMSTEDTLAGYFSVDAFVKELVSILRDPGVGGGLGNMSFGGDDMDEDLAMAIAASTGASIGLDNGNADEMQLLACRCLANLIEALPTASHNIVSNGAVPVLCGKLFEITFIDLAEQTISTLEKLSEEMPSSIVREGGLGALLTYLDFFSTHVQRTALTAVANCCNHLSLESFSAVRDAMPTLKNVLAYSDRKLVEKACLAITGIVDSYRHHPDKLEILLTGNDVLNSIASLLVPGTSNATAVDASTHSRILKLLTTAAKSSPEISISLITESNIHDIIYQLLTGISPPANDEGVQGIKKHLEQDDMLVLNNLVHRSKDVVQETLNLVHELMPALPRDGIFDPKAHMHRSSRSKVKRESSQSSLALPELGIAGSSHSSGSQTTASTVSPARSANRSPTRASASAQTIVKTEEVTPAPEDDQPSSGVAGASSMLPPPKPKETAQEKRVQSFRTEDVKKLDGIHRFFALLLPILLDVYVASVGVQVRSKAFQSMLKIVQYCHQEYLRTILTIVPMASFLASCFSSRDQLALVIEALQMTELLLTKVPDTYQYFFRREGVMFEIEKMADEPLVNQYKSRKSSRIGTPSGSNASTPNVPGSATPADDGGDAADLGTRTAPSASAIIAAVGSTTASSRPNNMSSSEALLRDSVTLRARHLKKMLTESGSAEGSNKADSELNKIRALVQVLDDVSAMELGQEGVSLENAEKEASDALVTLAGYFSGKDTMSSFEMQESGMIEGLLRFATHGKRSILTNENRQDLILRAFMTHDSGTEVALSALVKRLQEALGRAEEFDVVTALPSGGDSRQNPATMLARQLKIRLIAEENCGIPKSVTNVVVSIHAIATFQAFNDYLRPRISSAIAATERASPSGSPHLGPTGASRLSGVLAAFAAATGMPASELEAATAALTGGLASPEASASSSTPTASNTKPTRPSAPQPERRRSSRLSAKSGPSQQDTPMGGSGVSQAQSSGSTETSVAQGDASAGNLAEALDDNADIVQDDLDAPPPSQTEERPVNFEVAADGSRINASTPDGTRVQTPQPGASSTKSAATGSSSLLASTRPSHVSRSSASTPSTSTAPPPTGRSYAAALKSAPSDWHLEFSMGGKTIDFETTIFGAVYQHEVRSGNANGIRGVWHNVYNVTFKKVPGPPPTPEDRSTPEPHSFETALPDFLARDPRQATVLRLLSVLHQVNSDYSEQADKHKLESLDASRAVAQNVFVNNKLTAKLNRQLEEPMIVASNCLPDWAMELPQLFPFIFPFETRYTFLQSTSFGYARLMQKWLQSARTTADSNAASNRRDENLSFLGRLQRQKVRISRQRLFESAFKVFELYGSSKAMLEVEYFDEVGTGLGPTLEFYSLVSKEFRKKSLGIWRDGDNSNESEYVANALGLFPAPIDPANLESEEGKKQAATFKVLGTVVAKALMDSRIIDIPFNRMFMKLVLSQHIPLNTVSVRAVDPTLAKSLEHLNLYLQRAHEIQSDGTMSAEEKAKALAAVKVDDASIEDLSLDFTIPGYDIELKPNGKETPVDLDNLAEYLELVIEWTLAKGVKPMVSKFKEGFSEVFPTRDLHTFAPEELLKLFGDEEEDWSFATIHKSLKADHGYSLSSPSILSFIEIISHFDHPTRRKALSFFTGASRLPIGGFKALNPPLTVVRKLPEDGLTPDEVLPSVMTCANFVKMPEYSSKEVMEERVTKAIEEGGGAFHLS